MCFVLIIFALASRYDVDISLSTVCCWAEGRFIYTEGQKHRDWNNNKNMSQYKKF